MNVLVCFVFILPRLVDEPLSAQHKYAPHLKMWVEDWMILMVLIPPPCYGILILVWQERYDNLLCALLLVGGMC